MAASWTTDGPTTASWTTDGPTTAVAS
ncbi:MAG: hypothetical protein JWN17_2303, partial [Frankiales bacterium]|nr:hypothetical protein [Frankiales bacterium]